jgi:nucleolar pre-ribosomal-associated protein 1
MSLVLRSGLLSWIEMQVSNANGEDGIAWVKILRNIIVVVDAAKVETSTNGQWRAVLCRCLTLLLATCEPCTWVLQSVLTPLTNIYRQRLQFPCLA